MADARIPRSHASTPHPLRPYRTLVQRASPPAPQDTAPASTRSPPGPETPQARRRGAGPWVIAGTVVVLLVGAFFAGAILLAPRANQVPGAAAAPARTADPAPSAEGTAPVRTLSGTGDGDGGTAINLVSAHDVGCTTDVNTPADPAVRVYLDGKLVLERVADQDGSPLYAALAFVRPNKDSIVRVTGYDEEGNNGPDTPCDLDVGVGTEALRSWDGSYLDLTLRGNEARSLEVHLVLGHAPATITNLQADASATQATLSWSAPQVDLLQLAGAGTGRVIRTLDADARSTTLEGLCDNLHYSYRVIATVGAWSVGSDISFRTDNVAPAAPQVLRADRSGSYLDLEWEDATAHDIDHYEVHVGASGFSPSASTKVSTEKPFSDWRNQHAYVRTTAEGVVRIVAVDSAGASATSPEFAVGAPAVKGQYTFSDGCRGS